MKEVLLAHLELLQYRYYSISWSYVMLTKLCIQCIHNAYVFIMVIMLTKLRVCVGTCLPATSKGSHLGNPHAWVHVSRVATWVIPTSSQFPMQCIKGIQVDKVL